MRVFIVSILFCLLFINQTSNAQTKAESLKRQAIIHMRIGKYGEAIDLLNKYIVKTPRRADGYNLRGLCYEKRENWAYAVYDIRRARKLEPGNAEIQRNYARVRAEYDKILYHRIEGLKRDIAIDPSVAFNYLEVGKSYVGLEEWDMAENWYDQYLAKDPDPSPDEIIRYTLILQETKHLQKGRKILQQYVQLYPEDWRLWSRLGYFNLWLGYYKDAERTFLQALSFKPFFKEAEEGLLLARREIFANPLVGPEWIDQREEQYPGEYAIDKYYRMIRQNPNDDETRFLLISELMLHNRCEEAYQQANYLRPNFEGESRFDDQMDEIIACRETYMKENLEMALRKLTENPNDGEAAMQVATYYSSLEKYDEAIEILQEYLDLNPKDTEAKYLLAKIEMYNQRFDEAYGFALQAVEEDPANTKYKLLAAQLGVWTPGDLDLAAEHLDFILEREPDNLYALIAYGSLLFAEEKYSDSWSYANRAKALEPDNPDVQKLVSMLELASLREKELEYLKIADKGRELVNQGDCEGAIPYYEEYINSTNPKLEFREEMSNVYACAHRWDDAIDQLDIILDEGPDYEIEKERAKIYYWSGDSSEALYEFTRLAEEDPEDLEVKLYLGDSYLKMAEYDSARSIYNSLKDSGAPESYMIDTRLSWLPTGDSFSSGVSYYLFSYLLLSPRTYYFNDNLDFEYMYWGVGAETSLMPSITIGGSFVRGFLANTWGRLSFSTFKGTLAIRPSDNLLLSFGYGRMYSPGVIEQPVIDANIKYSEPDVYSASLTYTRSNAAVILYSANLVSNSLAANSIRFDGFYNWDSGLRIDGYYQFVFVDKTTTFPMNLGNTLNLRLSKAFYKDLRVGYEFEFADYKYDTNLYWTPQTYSHHALWTEWDVLKNDIYNFTVGGRLGYVPVSDYFLRSAWARFSFKLLDNLSLAANGYVGSTVREIVGYSSGSFYLNLFWTLF